MLYVPGSNDKMLRKVSSLSPPMIATIAVYRATTD